MIDRKKLEGLALDARHRGRDPTAILSAAIMGAAEEQTGPASNVDAKQFTDQTAHSGEINQLMTQIRNDVHMLMETLEESVMNSIQAIVSSTANKNVVPQEVAARIRKQLKAIVTRDLGVIINMPETYGG